MTLKQWSLDSESDGTVATAANTGAYSISAGDGSITFSSAAAHSGTTGLRFATTSTGSYVAGKFDCDADNNLLALSMVFALPALPQANGGILVTHHGTGPTFVIETDGTVVWNASENLHPTTDYQITAGQQYRIAAQINAAGTLQSKLYTADGSTPLATWDLSGLSFAGPYSGIELGTLSSTPGLVILVDDLQADDGRTTEIPGMTAQPAMQVGVYDLVWTGSAWK